MQFSIENPNTYYHTAELLGQKDRECSCEWPMYLRANELSSRNSNAIVNNDKELVKKAKAVWKNKFPNQKKAAQEEILKAITSYKNAVKFNATLTIINH